MGGDDDLPNSELESWESESSDEDGLDLLDSPPAKTGEPYTSLPRRSHSGASFSQKVALHLLNLSDLSEEATGFSDKESCPTEVTFQTTAQIRPGSTTNERRTQQEDKSLRDEDEENEMAVFMRILFLLPMGTMYMGLCTPRKENKGLRQIGKLAALLWCLAWIVLIAVCITVSVILIRGKKELLIPLRWDTPYSMRQTTHCGTTGASIKVEHEAMTHILSEKTYGTVAFIGLMPAKTWSDAELLKHVYNLGFDAVAVSPPGIGATTNVTSLVDSFYNDENFLNQVLESCLDIRLASAVVVSHSNIVTRQYFFPLLMNTALLGYVLFDSYTGEDWITEVNPALNDHMFYSPKTRNYRYVGNRRLSEEPYEDAVVQLVEAVNCIAAEFSEESGDAWEDSEPQTLGPYQSFPGKYKVPGWGLKQAELLAAPLDPAPDKKSSLLDVLSSTGAGIFSSLSGSEEQVDSVLEESRLVPSRQAPLDYFSPLKEALTDILTEIRDKIDLGVYHPEQLPVAFREDRKQAYIKARVNTTLIDPSTIYCLHGAPAIAFTVGTEVEDNAESSTEDLERPRVEGPQRPRAEKAEHDNSARPKSLQTNSPNLRGGDNSETPSRPDAEKLPFLRVEAEANLIVIRNPAAHKEYLGGMISPVNPERFSSEEKQKLLKAYARHDRIRAMERATRFAKSAAQQAV